jgi:UDP-N-acetylglucosamine 2-epimerase
MKVILVVGTRPQIIKSQPIVKELLSKKMKLQIIHTGQHYDYEMSKSFFKELEIKDPDLNLGIKKGSSIQQLSQIIQKLEKPLLAFNPDYVLVPGDTRSALGAGICASRLGLKLVHIEAGARSNDFTLEEEVNRRIIDQSSRVLFAPTKHCLDNLKKEKVLGKSYFTGDSMYDVFLEFQKKLNLKKDKKNQILMTIHRKANIENYSKIKRIINLANQITKLGYKVIFPVHPHTEKQLKEFHISINKINTIKPVNYSKILSLLAESKMMITDSGGLQKEAYWMNTPCITIRKSTEWIETLKKDHNILLDSITDSSVKIVTKILSQKISDVKISEFGDGHASKKMVSLLYNNL